MPLNVIVHADDFGLCDEVNRGIVAAHEQGILTSASLMPTALSFDDAVERARLLPSLDVGVHLTLVEEAPLLPANEIRTLVDERGRLLPDAATVVKRYLGGRLDLDEVGRELDAQVRRVVESGLEVSHLDSHQHLHVLPGIMRIATDLARRFDIPWIRRPRERIARYMLSRPSGWPRLAQMLVLNGFCRAADFSTVRTTQYFAGFYFGGQMSCDHLRIVLDNLPATGTCELMCHPGEDRGRPPYAHWQYRWQEELDALLDPRIAALVEQRDINLINYADI